MHKLYILLLSTFTLSTPKLFAFNPVDSIGVENYKGNKLILHKVEPKETYFAISRRYKVPYQEIMSFNDNKALGIGIIIKVPTNIAFAKSTQTIVNGKSTGTFEYTIQKKDNLNALAERFGTTIDAIKQENGLRNANLQIGQVIRIPGNQTTTTTSTGNANQVDLKPIAQTTVQTPASTTETIEHTVQKKEYLGIIAKNYNVTVEQLKEINGLSSNNLSIGQVLKIPSNATISTNNIPTNVAPPVEKAVTNTIEKDNTSKKEEASTDKLNQAHTLEHIVAPNETIYSIAKKYNLTTYQIQVANNLSTNDLKVGQKLILKSDKAIAAATEIPANTEEQEASLKNPSLKLPASRYGLSQIEEKGTAVWISDEDLDAAKMLVLHRTAPVGTVIKITNPMNNRSTLAKVVGKFTENESTKDVIIVMTKAVAEAVGALDKRFFCNLTYGIQENGQ